MVTRRAGLDLHVHDLHGHLAARATAGGLDGAHLARAGSRYSASSAAVAAPDHAAEQPVTLEVGHRTPRATDLAERGARARLDQHDVAHVKLGHR